MRHDAWIASLPQSSSSDEWAQSQWNLLQQQMCLNHLTIRFDSPMRIREFISASLFIDTERFHSAFASAILFILHISFSASVRLFSGGKDLFRAALRLCVRIEKCFTTSIKHEYWFSLNFAQCLGMMTHILCQKNGRFILVSQSHVETFPSLSFQCRSVIQKKRRQKITPIVIWKQHNGDSRAWQTFNCLMDPFLSFLSPRTRSKSSIFKAHMAACNIYT